MKCGSCGGEDIKLVTGADVYPRRADLHERNFWRCTCGAYVGCHSGTEQPYGTPANQELRRLRMRTHELFDPFWESYGMTRTEAYAFLSKQLRIPSAECHIGLFDVARCKLAIQVAQKQARYIEHVMKIGEATKFSTWTGAPLSPESREIFDRDRWMRDLERSIAESERENECVNAGKCPTCGGPVRRTIEKWQAGPVELASSAGTWVSYRCASHPPIGTVRPPGVCEWTGFDRKEPQGEN